MKNAIFVLAALLIGLSSCKKDEEEQEPTLSKEEILCREWKLDKLFFGEYEQELTDKILLEFKTDKSVLETQFDSENNEVIYGGEWRFTKDEEYLEVSELDWEGKFGNTYLFPFIKNTSKSDDWTEYEIQTISTNKLILVIHHETENDFKYEYLAN